MNINSTTKVFVFASKDSSVIPNFKRFYPGLSMLGKHFLVNNVDGESVARHYTVCNAMQQDVFQELVRLLSANERPANIDRLKAMLSTQDQTSISLTIKNYNQPTGLSVRFFDQAKADYQVKGPMGKPLGIEATGTYLLFAGGTGVLPFMDLIAQFAFACLGICESLG